MAKPRKHTNGRGADGNRLRSDRIIFVSLEPETKLRLQELARADDRTVSQLVRRIIDRALSEAVQKRAA